MPIAFLGVSLIFLNVCSGQRIWPRKHLLYIYMFDIYQGLGCETHYTKNV